MSRVGFLLTIALVFSGLMLTGCPKKYDVVGLSNTSYDFGLSDLPWAFQVWNADASKLAQMSFNVSSNQSWLSCDPKSGVSTGSSGADGKKVIRVTVNRNGLSAGKHKATITISGAHVVSKEVAITVTSEGSTDGTGGWTLRNVTPNYSAPYLLEYSFSLGDANGHSVVAEPAQFTVTCKEDSATIGSETGFQLAKGANKQLLAYLVLDYTYSMANIAANGDDDKNGRSDAIDEMEAAAKNVFLDALTQDAQVGIYEFHREDQDPMQVAAFTTDRAYLKSQIDQIWTKYVKKFPASTRCWDALYAAVGQFSDDANARKDEQRAIVFLSDGRDESSVHNYQEVIDEAKARGVVLYCIGFGAELDITALQVITSQTNGQYYSAGTAEDLGAQFEQITTDLGGQYVLRWATLKRTEQATFLPSFTLLLSGHTLTYTAPDDELFNPKEFAGDPLRGHLRTAVSSSTSSATAFLRASYVPRYVTRISLRAESPYALSKVDLVPATDAGLCDPAAWSLLTSNDPKGGTRIIIESANPDDYETAIPYSAFGSILRFDFDTPITDPATAFTALEVDNTIYDNGQAFDVN